MGFGKSRISHSKELCVALFLGAVSFISSFVAMSFTPADSPFSYSFRVIPLFFAGFLLSDFGFFISLICTVAAHILLSPQSPVELLQLCIPPLIVFGIHRLGIHILPHIVILTLFTLLSLFYPQALPQIAETYHPLLIALLTTGVLLGSVMRFNSKLQDFLGISQPRGWLMHVVPLIIYFTIIPFLIFTSQSTDNSNFIWLSSVFIAGLFSLPYLPRPNTSAFFETDSSKHIIDSLLARPRGFSGLGKDFWKRKDDSPSETIALTTRLATGIAKTDQSNQSAIKSDDGVCSLSRGGVVSFMNRRFREFLNVSANQVIGKDIAEAGIDTEHTKLLLSLLDRTFKFGPQIAELRSALPQGTRFFEIKTLKADSIEGSSLSGDPESVIITVSDITVRRSVESQVLKAQRLEAISSLSKGTVQTIYDSISRLSATFSGGDSETKKLVDEISNLTSQLLSFTKNPTSTRHSINLGKFLEEHKLLIQKGIPRDIIFEIPSNSSELSVNIDTQLILQALMNLLLNAHESYKDNSNGTITLSLSSENFSEDVLGIHMGARAGKFARIQIKDNGTGMTSDVLARAFEPFFSTKKQEGHQGLGLSSVFAIIRDHDGFLTTVSSPSSGTTITIYLPLVS